MSFVAEKMPKGQHKSLDSRSVYPWDEWFTINQGADGEDHGEENDRGDQYTIKAEQLKETTLESFRNAASTACRDRGMSLKTQMEYKTNEKGDFEMVQAKNRDGSLKVDGDKPVMVKVPKQIWFQAFKAEPEDETAPTEGAAPAPAAPATGKGAPAPAPKAAPAASNAPKGGQKK